MLHALPPSKIIANITRACKAMLVPIIRSSPAMGKSEIILNFAKQNRLYPYDFRLSQADITDLNGLPFRTESGRASFLPFDNFPLEGDELPDHPDGGKYNGWLLFFDELTSAGKQLQAAAYKIILERMVGNHKLHKRVVMICAGNQSTDNAVVHDMSTALQSRLIHLEMRIDHKEWMAWASKSGVDSRIIGFLEFKPEYLYNFRPDHSDHTYASPRTWWFAHKLVVNEDISMEDLPLLAGTIGPGVAHEFIAFSQIYAELPKLSAILADPNKAPIPNEPSAKYAMATHLVEHFTANNTKVLSKYLSRFPVEFQVITLRMLQGRQPALVRDPAIVSLWQVLASHL